MPTDEASTLKCGDASVIQPTKTHSAAVAFDLLAAIEGAIERDDVHFQDREF
jgi:hypothetical protein